MRRKGRWVRRGKVARKGGGLVSEEGWEVRSERVRSERVRREKVG